MESRCRVSSIYSICSRNRHGNRCYHILYKNKFHKILRQIWENYTRRTPTANDCGRCCPSYRLVLVRLVLPPQTICWNELMSQLRTSSPHMTWVPQVLSSALIGMGSLVTFWQGMNYIIDCYAFYSNSAIAINTFVRSIAGAVFPLFGPAMYHNLGVPWASSILAFLCVAFLPVPVLFYKYGAKIRSKSRFNPNAWALKLIEMYR